MNIAAAEGGLPLRALLEASWRARRKLIGLAAATSLGFAGIGIALPPGYVSHSTLILLLGPEYTVRTPAGLQPPSNTSFDADHILGTETEILSSDDLHRDVIRAIGVRRLYPKLLQPPSLPLRIIAAIKGLPDRLARMLAPEPTAVAARDDPVEEAVAIFAAKLQIKPSKLANVITLGFPHRDPVVARDTLRVLERLYLQRRRTLYERSDSRAMHADVLRARSALDAADAALASFRSVHALPDYAAQLATLLQAQGDIEHDGIDARRAEASGQARIAALESERTRLPSMVNGGSDSSLDAHTQAVRDDIEMLRAHEAATLSRYRTDSPAVRDIETQLQSRSSELSASRPATLSATHSVRNASLDQVVGSLLQLRSAQRGLDAQLADDDAEEIAIERRIAVLGENQRALDALTTRRSVLLDDLRRLESAASSQADAEAVEAASRPSVRIASAPNLPIRPLPIRLLLIGAGLIFGMFVSVAAALTQHATRRTILSGDEFEALGVALLARMPRNDAMMAMKPLSPVTQ